MLSMVKSKDGYRKMFHKTIAVIPSSSLNSLKSNPVDDLPDDQRFEELTYETLEDVIDMVGKKRRRIINIITIR
jgi:hypothetical protein